MLPTVLLPAQPYARVVTSIHGIAQSAMMVVNLLRTHVDAR